MGSPGELTLRHPWCACRHVHEGIDRRGLCYYVSTYSFSSSAICCSDLTSSSAGITATSRSASGSLIGGLAMVVGGPSVTVAVGYSRYVSGVHRKAG